jgi:hypothetical protein
VSAFFVTGVAAIQEYIWGTQVRERAVEIFGRVLPWSRVVVKEWHPSEGRFDLFLSITSRRIFATPLARDTEIIVPVAASERPPLEAFLAARTATAG